LFLSEYHLSSGLSACSVHQAGISDTSYFKMQSFYLKCAKNVPQENFTCLILKLPAAVFFNHTQYLSWRGTFSSAKLRTGFAPKQSPLLLREITEKPTSAKNMLNASRRTPRNDISGQRLLILIKGARK
jgi:hypothetical protein